MKKNLSQKIKKIQLLLLDVDGVLTKGEIAIDHKGNEIKFFHVLDGFAMVLFKKLGYKTAILSARYSKAVQVRGKDLRVDNIIQGAYPKLGAYKSLIKKLKLTDDQVCFVADDVTDLGVFKRVGLAVAVKNAVPEIKKQADYITTKGGGEGAVREVVEMILKAHGKWQGVLASHS